MSLYEAVREAWENAWDGGYDTWLLESSPVDIAVDMMDGSSDVEEFANGDVTAVEQLVLLIKKEYIGG